MRHLKDIISGLAALSILLTSCASRPSANVAQSSSHRETSPGVPHDDLSVLVHGNNAFALDMYRSLHSQGGNLAFSPYSISLALAMTYAGARAETESQMAEALHYTLPQDRLHPAFNQLDLDLTRQSQPALQDEHRLQLRIANAVWAEQTFSFLQDYLDRIARNYGAGIQLADFVNQPAAVRKQINDWVGRQTADKIKNLIPDGVLDQTTKMVLVNALYFKADWQEQLDPKDTQVAPFTLLDGSQVQSHQMSNHLSGVPYASGKRAIRPSSWHTRVTPPPWISLCPMPASSTTLKTVWMPKNSTRFCRKCSPWACSLHCPNSVSAQALIWETGWQSWVCLMRSTLTSPTSPG
jgi:serpin B